MDEELKRESDPFERGAPVESRVEEHRIVEEASPGPDPAEAVPESIFPADREALIEAARTNGASEGTVAQLERLPAGETFRSPDELRRRLGGPPE